MSKTKEQKAARALQATLGCSYTYALTLIRARAPICGAFRFHLMGNDQCTLPKDHDPPCAFTEHDCPDCGSQHGVCRHCMTTHGDTHAENCPHAKGVR